MPRLLDLAASKSGGNRRAPVADPMHTLIAIVILCAMLAELGDRTGETTLYVIVQPARLSNERMRLPHWPSSPSPPP